MDSPPSRGAFRYRSTVMSLSVYISVPLPPPVSTPNRIDELDSSENEEANVEADCVIFGGDRMGVDAGLDEEESSEVHVSCVFDEIATIL